MHSRSKESQDMKLDSMIECKMAAIKAGAARVELHAMNSQSLRRYPRRRSMATASH
jgi:hypothetical protein